MDDKEDDPREGLPTKDETRYKPDSDKFTKRDRTNESQKERESQKPSKDDDDNG
jgi:hypothetical protein